MSDWLKGLAAEVGTSTARQLAGFIAFLVGVVLCVAVKHWWPDCPPSAIGVAMLAGVYAGLAAIILTVRAVTGSTDLLFDFTTAQARLVLGGSAVAFVFAVCLFAYEWHEQRASDAMRVQGQAQQEQYDQQMREIKRLQTPSRP